MATYPSDLSNDSIRDDTDGQPSLYNGRVKILQSGNYLRTLMTTLRDQRTGNKEFRTAVERVGILLIAAASDFLPTEDSEITTPTGTTTAGFTHSSHVCGISILRAGASLENALRATYSGPCTIGHILIQRNETTSLPTLIYTKFPEGFESYTVFILEPMLATGGSACMAIEAILKAGVPEHRIVFINVVASEEGLEKVMTRFPSLRLVTAAVDQSLTTSKHISPGLGDFGDRFYSAS